jgi:dihydroorotate dehydrogenase electron transfer subunit
MSINIDNAIRKVFVWKVEMDYLCAPKYVCMMKKQMLDLTVTSNTVLPSNYVLLKLSSDTILPEMLPGQFVNLRVDAAPTVFLRRPLSISFVDRTTNELWLLIQQVGDGTRAIAKAKSGDTVNVLLPLGNSFSLPQDKNDKLLLIGGGVGVAPMLMLGAYLKERGYQPQFLLGGRSQENLLLLNEFEKYGILHLCTDDGSVGEKGFVTQHSILQKENFDKLYVCGPTPMMKAVAQYASAREIDCEVSLENVMACGVGACLCCVTDTKEGHKCVCSDGPVFNINQLKWKV